MSEIDKLEIKIVADAADAEKSVKKLSKAIEGIGETGDSTKQIREIKSVLESIKTPEIEINGIKEFAKQASAIADSFSKIATSAKEIGVALKGVNLGQLTKKSKNLKMDGIAKVNTKMLNVSRGNGVKEVLTAEQKRWRDIPVFDMGKQINGKPIQNAAKSMSVYTAETENAESATKNLISTMKKFPKSTAPVIDQNKRLAESAMEFEMSYAREQEAIDAQERAQNGDKRGRQTSRRKTSNKSRGRSFGGLFGRSGGQKGFSLPKMVGMSVLYSTVFQLISTIKSAFAEGMQSLAQYSQSVNANISSMMSALMQLRNAFAAAFEPILSVVAPYLATFISWLAKAINMLGQFIAALTGKGYAVQAKKVQMDYAKSLQKTAGGAGKAAKALKEMQSYTLGFDELHVIDTKQNDSNGAAGGAGGGAGDLLPTDMFETVNINKSVSDFAKKLREAFNAGDWKELGSLLGNKVNSIVDSIDFSGFGSKIGYGINGAVQTAYSFLKTVDFINLGNHVADFINSALEEIDFTFVGRLFVRIFTSGLDFLIGALGGLDWKLIGKSIGDFLRGAFDEAQEYIANIDWSNAAQTLWTSVKNFIEGIDFGSLAQSFFKLLGTAIASAVTFIGAFVRSVCTDIFNYFKKYLVDDDGMFHIGTNILDGICNGIYDAASNLASWIIDNVFKPFVEGIKSAFGIHSPATEMEPYGKNILLGIMEGFVNSISEFITAIGTWASESFNTFSEKVSDIVGSVVTWFSEMPDKIGTAISTFVTSTLPTWATNIKNWISSAIPERINQIIDLFKGLPQGVYNAVTSMGQKIRDIGKWMWEGIKKGLLSVVPSGVKEVVSGILSGTKSAAEIHSPSKLFKREVGAYLGAGIVDGMKESVKGVGSVIDEIVGEVSGSDSLAPVVSLEAPDISQWNEVWDIARAKFSETKAAIVSEMRNFYAQINALSLTFGNTFKTSMSEYLNKTYDGIYNTFDAIRQTLQQVANEVTKMLNQMVSDANSLAGLTGKKYSHVGGYTMQQAQRFNIEMFANGGFPRSGELFIAREAGPELVGSIGGKTAVGGNDQIERAIFNAVLTAMSQVMANSNSQPIELNQKIELDGDVIYNNQQRVSARRGINFGLGAFQR